MNDQGPAGKDWSDSEIDLIVADYFDMLQLELSGQPFVKLHRNKALQEMPTGTAIASLSGAATTNATMASIGGLVGGGMAAGGKRVRPSV